jgi:hypothetical protein
MPKMTKKYSNALVASQWLVIRDEDMPKDQEALYHLLADHGLYWDSKAQLWAKSADEPSDAPTPFVSIRLWCDAEIVADAADCLVDQLTQARFHLVERSEPYPCRPPKQREARIYLRFYPPRKDTALPV